MTATIGVQRTDTILAYNDNASTQFNVDVPACTGNLSACSATPTPGHLTTVAQNGFLRVIIKYTAGSVGTGQLTINVSDNNTGLSSTGIINATVNGSLTVTPKTNNRTTIGVNGSGSYGFSVKNTMSSAETITITGSCTQQVTCSFTPVTRSFAANEVYPVTLSFTGNATGGTGYARISASTTGASDFAEDTVTVNPSPMVTVTPPVPGQTVPPGQTFGTNFAIKNTGTVTATFTIATNCPTLPLCYNDGTTQKTLAPGEIFSQPEPPRDCRRLQLVRGWSHDDQTATVFA